MRPEQLGIQPFHVAEEQCDILQQLDGKLVPVSSSCASHTEIYRAALNQFGIKADGALFIRTTSHEHRQLECGRHPWRAFPEDPVKLRELPLIANGVNIPAVQ